MIQHIRIRNFRSLHDVSVDLDPLTVLIGRSGTGKSNFVRAIRLLRNILAESNETNRRNLLDGHRPDILPAGQSGAGLAYDVTLTVAGLAGKFEYSVLLGPNGSSLVGVGYERLVAGGEVVFEKRGGSWTTPPPGERRPGDEELALGTVSGVRLVSIVRAALTDGIGCYDFPGSVLQDSARRPDTGSGFTDDGSTFLDTAKGIINNLERHGDWGEVVAAARALNKAVREIDLGGPGRNRLVATHQVGARFPLDVAQESEGFRRFLAHLLAMYQTPAKPTVLFEHPESGIHPGALAALFEEFEDYTRDRVGRKARGQVILTTHSPRLLDKFAADNIRVVDIEGGQTRIGPLAPEQMESVRDKLLFPGELLTVDPARLAEQLAGVAG